MTPTGRGFEYLLPITDFDLHEILQMFGAWGSTRLQKSRIKVAMRKEGHSVGNAIQEYNLEHKRTMGWGNSMSLTNHGSGSHALGSTA